MYFKFYACNHQELLKIRGAHDALHIWWLCHSGVWGIIFCIHFDMGIGLLRELGVWSCCRGHYVFLNPRFPTFNSTPYFIGAYPEFYNIIWYILYIYIYMYIYISAHSKMTSEIWISWSIPFDGQLEHWKVMGCFSFTHPNSDLKGDLIKPPLKLGMDECWHPL